MNHQIAPLGGWYRVMTSKGQLGGRVWIEPGQLVTLTSGQWIELDPANEDSYTLTLTKPELDAIQAALLWATQLNRSAIQSALEKAIEVGQERSS